MRDVLKTSQLDVNISYTKNGKLRKTHLTTITMEEGTNAEEISGAVIYALESSGISLEKLVQISTDGCSTMLGQLNGVQAIFRRRVPTLPDWGGCLGHDSSLMLKYGITKLDPEFITVSTAFQSYINGVSLHRKREYETFCLNLGLQPSKPPKHFDVRFRVINSQAHWLEKDDRCLYLFISELADRVKRGEEKDLTDTQMVLLEKYLGNYYEFRLNTKFLCDISDVIIKFLNTFESRKVRIHERHQIIVDFLYGMLAKLLKNAGLGEEDTVTAETILKVDFKNRSIHQGYRDLYLGPKVEAYLLESGLTRQSSEILGFLGRVRDFFVSVIEKAFKYLAPSLKSKTLQYLRIISPKFNVTASLDSLKRRYKHVAQQFSNIIPMAEIPELLEQVTLMKAQSSLVKLADNSPEEFFNLLQGVKKGKYSKVARLGQAVLTIYNSSCEAERDFSVQVRDLLTLCLVILL
jgi:hypothetical protein